MYCTLQYRSYPDNLKFDSVGNREFDPTLTLRALPIRGDMYPADSPLIIKAVQAGLQQVFREGFSYAKAQVILLDLCRKNEYTPDLFAPEQPVKTERLMSTLDAINNRWGRGTLQPGRIAKPVEWAMRRELLSPAYTTRWSELMVAKAK